MSIKRISSKLKDIFSFSKVVSNFNLVDKPLHNILILHDSTNSIYEKSLNDLKRAVSFLLEDYDFSFIDIQAQKITTEELKKHDFIIVNESLSSNDSRFKKSLRGIAVPKGIMIRDSKLKESSTELNFYEVVWFFNFEFAKQLKHPRKFHAFKDEAVEYQLNTPNWDHKYYGSQIKKGLISVVKDDTRTSKRFYSDERFKVGKDSFYNSNFQIIGKDAFVEIGSYCSLGNNIKLYTTNHDVNFPSTQGYLYRKYFKTDHPGENQSNPSISRTKGPIIIKNDVWIGDDVKIMSGVTIGNGACIAAGSIVTNDISDFEIVGGVPARLLKYRFSDEIMSFLKAIEWWDWSDKKIKNNKHFFDLNLNEPIDIKNFKINT